MQGFDHQWEIYGELWEISMVNHGDDWWLLAVIL